MEMRRYRSLLNILLIDSANAVIVVAMLIYPITWILNMVSKHQQEVDVELYLRYVLIVFSENCQDGC